MRQLIWIPIVHTQTDLGSLGEEFKRTFIQRAGRARWAEHVRAVDRLWQNIAAEVDRLGLDWSQVRLYQDGLPICGREEELVREVARAGSKNHQLLLELMGRGARLTGTESPELLVEEYNLSHSLTQTQGQRRPDRSSGNHERLRQDLLTRRDRFIATRIAETLEADWTGLLFLGMLHSIEGLLPGDVEVRRL